MCPQIIPRLSLDILGEEGVESVHYFFRSALGSILANRLEPDGVASFRLFHHSHVAYRQLQLAGQGGAAGHGLGRLVEKIVHGMR